MIEKIKKRDGRIVDFNKEKIANAIFKAAQAVGGKDYELAKKLADEVVQLLEKKFKKKIPSVEDVQDLVEKVLIEHGHSKTAKAYILYREERKKLRETKAALGVKDDIKLGINAIKVLKSRYLLKDDYGNVIETPGQLFRRVAHDIALAEKEYGASEEEIKELEEKFYKLMAERKFMPNSPTLMNAGTRMQQLSACFVLPVPDDIAGIFDAVKYTALIQQCLVPETLVMTQEGLVPLGSVKENQQILTDSGIYNVSKVFNNGIQKTYKVITEHGYEIQGTKEHRLLIVDENGLPDWRRISELKINDYVILSYGKWLGKKRKLPDFKFKFKPYNKTSFKPIEYKLPKYLNEELAELIGYFIGDGSNHRDGIRFTISKEEKDLLERIKQLSISLFGKNPVITEYKSTYEVAILSKQIKEWFNFLGIKKKNSRQAEIPELILKADEYSVCAFLKALFTCDGCIRKNGHITFSSASEKLIKTLQIMLIHLGIPTRLYQSKKTKVFHLSICTKKGFLNYKQKIGFSSRKKQERLFSVNEEKIFTRGEVIPNQRERLIRWYKSLPRGEKVKIQHLVDGIVNRKKDKRELTYQKLLLLSEQKLKPEFISELLSRNFFYTKIVKIIPCSEREVYDLTIPYKHSYIANGFITHNSGGGTGFSFSRLRPKDDIVRSTKGQASGPVSFMRVFNIVTDVIKQGGKRRGANMGILRVDHPDILEFITCKEKEGEFANFNISVAITNKFMKAVKENKDYELINPRTGKVVKKLNARKVWDLIITMAWKNGEPGVIFIDTINKYNPTPEIGEIEATNPCGEQPLLPYEACNLGSINLEKFVIEKDGKAVIDWKSLEEAVKLAVHFLDNVIDRSKFPVDKITEMVKANRKIGLGVMGFAHMLIKLGIKYNSEEAVKTAEKVMKFITNTAREKSVELGKKKGSFPNFKKSIWYGKYEAMRNAAVTTIAPTGTISIVAETSSGIEPLFAVSFVRQHVLGGEELIEVNPLFEEIAKKRGFYSEELMKKIAGRGSIQDIKEIPKDVREIFVTTFDIPAEWHVRIQAAFQKYTDNAVSKTINFPPDATIADVEKVYMLAYELGCKGITVYRHGSREKQVLNIIEKSPSTKKAEEKPEYCPECGTKLVFSEGCYTCPSCGFSKCSV